MKAKIIAYWVTTVLVAFAMGSGGIVDMLRLPDAVAVFDKLGYPSYFATIIGVWKVLGAIVLVAPRMPLVKEWAYAGILFDLTGAAASHAFSGDGVRFIATPLVLAAIAIASWALRPESRRLKLKAPANNPA